MPMITVNSEPPKPTTFEDLGYVQVVRCKDCVRYEQETGCCKNKVVHGNAETWFCADGERKD